MPRTPNRPRRRGIAATEMVIIAPILLTLLVGLWEVGRVIMVLNLLDNAAREGARISASGAFLSSANRNTPAGTTLTMNPPSKNIDYELQKKVLAYLAAAGVSTTGATVTVKNNGTSAAVKTWESTYEASDSGTLSGYDPAVNADQLDNLKITVTVPYTSVGWSPLNLFFPASTTLRGVADWVSMKDVPLTVGSNIPSRPILSTETIP